MDRNSKGAGIRAHRELKEVVKAIFCDLVLENECDRGIRELKMRDDLIIILIILSLLHTLLVASCAQVDLNAVGTHVAETQSALPPQTIDPNRINTLIARTKTARPTQTPIPSNTPLPTPTPLPSDTPTPTFSPTPTDTLHPTATERVTFSGHACLPENAKVEKARVYRIIDGDTIEVSMNGRIYDVRYIGINTPETNQEFGAEATNENRSLLSSGQVILIKDVSETDQYGRLLRYVYSNGRFVNKALVRRGYAQAATYPPDVSCAHVFRTAEENAREDEIGLWQTSSGGSGSSDNCHPSYPTVCIPPPPPDLDCGDISYRRFSVIGSDPHRFDGDNDGVGCER